MKKLMSKKYRLVMAVEGFVIDIEEDHPVFMPKEHTYYSSDTYTKSEAEVAAKLRNQTEWPFDRHGNPTCKRIYSIIAIDKLESAP